MDDPFKDPQKRKAGRSESEKEMLLQKQKLEDGGGTTQEAV